MICAFIFAVSAALKPKKAGWIIVFITGFLSVAMFGLSLINNEISIITPFIIGFLAMGFYKVIKNAG